MVSDASVCLSSSPDIPQWRAVTRKCKPKKPFSPLKMDEWMNQNNNSKNKKINTRLDFTAGSFKGSGRNILSCTWRRLILIPGYAKDIVSFIHFCLHVAKQGLQLWWKKTWKDTKGARLSIMAFIHRVYVNISLTLFLYIELKRVQCFGAWEALESDVTEF